MTPTEMELRVATAIYDARFGSHASLAASDEEFAKYIKQARAAIRAMREPTPEMTSPHVHGEMWSKSRLTTWQAMIDAASPPETKP